MFPEKASSSSNSSEEEQQLRPISNLVATTDRMLDRSFHWVTNRWFSSYDKNWTGDFEDTFASSFPTYFWGQRERFKDSCHRGSWNSKKLGQNPEIVGGVSEDGSSWILGGSGPDGSKEAIALDRTKPTNLWAFPVPTTSQHDKCKELEGQGVWTPEGVWRCLFPLDKRQVEVQTNKGKPGSGAKLEDRKLFGDYTAYMDWKSAIRKAMRTKEEQIRLEKKLQHEKAVAEHEARAQAALERQQQEFRKQELKRQEQQYLENERLAQLRLSQLQSENEKWKSAQSAKFDESMVHEARWDNDSYNPKRPVKAQVAEVSPGKEVVSTTTVNETFIKQDGTSETKKTVTTHFKDGTSSVTENVSSSRDQSGNSKGGWFWK